MRISLEDLLNVSQGLQSGVAMAHKFGRNADIDIGTEDIWTTGGTWAAPATAAVVNFASSDAADTSAGTGARTISVEGLDSNYDSVTETVTLNGATPVATSSGFWIVHNVSVLTAGSGGTNAGVITGTSAAAGTPVLASVAIGKGRSENAIYMVPRNKTLLLFDISGSTTTTGTVNIGLWTKTFGGVFNIRRNYSVNGTGSSSFSHDFVPPLKIEAKTIVKLTGEASSNNSDVSADWDGILIDN